MLFNRSSLGRNFPMFERSGPIATPRSPILSQLPQLTAEVQGARQGVAPVDDARLRQPEIATRGRDADGLHFGDRNGNFGGVAAVGVQTQFHCPARTVGMAMAAVGMKISAGPRFQRLTC